ncbi:hypothetical protein [uncultured Mediterranean phage uvMED]|nr:hypothetical protein [uncultured Mediterranean phage uvMED]BAR16555.1 hypothetical protein [uncultured Mediterranean phage uvMED]
MAKFRIKDIEVLTENVSRLYNQQAIDKVKQHKTFIDVQEKTNILLKERKNHLDLVRGIDETIEEWANELNHSLCEQEIVSIKYGGYGDKELSVDAYIYRIQKQMMYEAVKAADDSSVKSLQEIEDRLLEKFISS